MNLFNIRNRQVFGLYRLNKEFSHWDFILRCVLYRIPVYSEVDVDRFHGI